ncbi:hypothetical protein MMRN_38450 [Mycobacterium marinum]|uniref:hypothetical protein n=1 Tax=Mycobacterium marinum TaxID=1781 RepID=UPI000CD9223C|nr:hypothetical protein [Mycobacterium marinum]AXN50940.1 hypothetical protein CCUG20998_03538 [Mycobacterium marinum]RFZ25462.1 hypothetical protein DSM43519_01648 [Mycobacterium marinum]RFZ28349.1 hypothetical protein DSM44344_01394 [Mycobacterium marinum]RFZ33824.1 hypothetical protein NCTC2275_02670 [Mycobacterium marinum]WOR02991.1 hypothetical protein QDR78_17415 [Mycobacterium marinum]
MTDPFMVIADFVDEYQGTLTTGETATATRLLQVASDRIRGLKSDVDDTAAQQVVFEIVRDAAMYGDLERLSEWENTTSRRTEAGKFASLVDDYLTDKHKTLLDIPLTAEPVYSFTKCDY